MPKLYIANCTKQNYDFLYRMPETKRIHQASIPVGQQVRVHSDNLQPNEIEYIIGQHTRYGLVAVEDIDRTKTFIGMCYSIDKPVNINKVMSAVQHNDEVLEARGHQTRKESAVAINQALDEAHQQRGNKPGSLRETSVEIQEQPRKGDDSPLLQETIVVEPSGSTDKPQGRGNRRNRS